MEILNKIGIADRKSPFVASIGSSAKIGKTTMMIVLASELISEGKNVLFISEDSTSNILRKASKFTTDSPKNGKLVVIGKFYEIKRLQKIIDGRDFDYIFLDSYIFNDEKHILETINLLRSQNINTFVSVQLSRVIEPITNSHFSSVSVMQYIDYAYVLTKKEKLSFWEKAKYWIRFIRIPNFNLNLIKNRYGKNKKIDFHIDINKLN